MGTRLMNNVVRTLCLLLTAAAALATAADTSMLPPQLPDLPTVKRPPALLPGPEDALSQAIEDAEKIDPYQRPFVRYVFLAGKVEDLKALSLAVNTVSRSPVLMRPYPVNAILARLDLRKYAPQEDDLQEWLKLWEELRFDPLFSRLITQDEADGPR